MHHLPDGRPRAPLSPDPNPKLDLQKLGWHDAQVMPDLKPTMGDLTLHSVPVVAVVSERQGQNHFSLNQKLIAQPDCAR